MQKILDLLGTKTEDETVELVRKLALRPVVVTVSLDALGTINVSSLGGQPKDLVEKALTEALKLVLRTTEETV